ncbi:hypothetical protein [Novosphingobium olei]|uniref:Uncharacterized protein n=1 Tax=Novosphingobium olei TaxID=2728851 RepID=A0A7Y0BRY0_9SPHN|nr:hypothetical protein [Novosphingobium olei]NML95456.1 hypothetical protein [Novosphingobium olei]
MSEEHSRWIVVSLVLLVAIPLQVVIIKARWDYVNGFDWLMLVLLIVLGWAHIEAPTPDP